MTIRKKMVQLFLNNVGINYWGPVIHEYFSVINTAEWLDLWLIESADVEKLQTLWDQLCKWINP